MIFLNSASSAAALLFYLPGGVCTHTDTEGKERKTRVWNILKSSKKKAIFNENPVSIPIKSIRITNDPVEKYK